LETASKLLFSLSASSICVMFFRFRAAAILLPVFSGLLQPARFDRQLAAPCTAKRPKIVPARRIALV
jgi:hypothetical protein